jgi:CubicO group peptidase (beta-lactamase class C family)
MIPRARFALLGLGLSLALPSILPAQTPGDLVDRYLQAEMTKRMIPGLQVAVVRHGRIEKLASYGMANLELGVPVTNDQLFQINSTTKSFTSVGVLMLAEAGKFRLDDPIGEHLNGLPASWHDVTIRQLLNHTSGLPDVIDNPMTGTMLARTVPDALGLLADKPMMFPRGTSWSYNQTNYMLLGMLIEAKSGMPWPEFCLKRELAPLGITQARWGDARTVVPGRASGYTKYNTAGGEVKLLDQVENTWYEFDPFLYTAAALNLSAKDFATWVIGLLDGKLVSRASLEEIWTPTKLADGTVFHLEGTPLGYGLGWPLFDRAKHRAVGGSGGVRAGFYVYPDDDLTVIVLTNLMGAQPDDLIEGVARIYIPDLAAAQ